MIARSFGNNFDYAPSSNYKSFDFGIKTAVGNTITDLDVTSLFIFSKSKTEISPQQKKRMVAPTIFIYNEGPRTGAGQDLSP